MPKIRRGKEPPQGWEIVEDTLKELEKKMRDGIVDSCSRE
jgi:hypothetical protein